MAISRSISRSIVSSALVCLAAGIAVGCTTSKQTANEHAAETTAEIQGGADDGAGHPYAVGVCAGAKGNCQGVCSGALILPNVVVTARHCVDETPKIIDCKAATPIRFGASEGVNWITTSNKMFQQTQGWHQIDQIIVPTDDRVCGHDIAILILNDLVPATEAKPIIPGVQYPMGDVNRYAHSYTAIGYGITAPNTNTSGTRRLRQNIPVLCIPNDEFIGCPDDANVNPNEFVGGDGTCEGDSGSSSFDSRSYQKGTPVSFGVLSRGGESDDGLTCKQAIYSRFDMWRDLVVQAAATASQNWTLYPKPVPDWTVYVPPPPDAGAPETGTKKPSNLPQGTGCDDNTECASGVCADTGAGKACTTACDDAVPESCSEGMVCKESVCVINVGGTTNPSATTSSTTTSGCSASPPGTGPLGGYGAGLAAALGLIFAVRRRCRPAKT